MQNSNGPPTQRCWASTLAVSCCFLKRPSCHFTQAFSSIEQMSSLDKTLTSFGLSLHSALSALLTTSYSFKLSKTLAANRDLNAFGLYGIRGFLALSKVCGSSGGVRARHVQRVRILSTQCRSVQTCADSDYADQSYFERS